jgi:hypothetical protein
VPLTGYGGKRFQGETIYFVTPNARVAKSVDARDLKSLGSNPVRVRVPPRALVGQQLSWVISLCPSRSSGRCAPIQPSVSARWVAKCCQDRGRQSGLARGGGLEGCCSIQLSYGRMLLGNSLGDSDGCTARILSPNVSRKQAEDSVGRSLTGAMGCPGSGCTDSYGAVLGGLFGLLLWPPPPQLPELPAQAKDGLVSTGPVSEFAESVHPARVSTKSAPRGRSVRIRSPALYSATRRAASVRSPDGVGGGRESQERIAAETTRQPYTVTGS